MNLERRSRFGGEQPAVRGARVHDFDRIGHRTKGLPSLCWTVRYKWPSSFIGICGASRGWQIFLQWHVPLTVLSRATAACRNQPRPCAGFFFSPSFRRRARIRPRFNAPTFTPCRRRPRRRALRRTARASSSMPAGPRRGCSRSRACSTRRRRDSCRHGRRRRRDEAASPPAFP